MMQQLTTFSVTLPEPIDLAASLALFQRHGFDGLDFWDGTTLVRTFPLGGQAVPFLCRSAGATITDALQVSVTDPAHEAAARATAAALFIPAPAAEWPALLASDAALAALNERFPHIRTVRQLDLYTSLVRSISAQQVNLTWATTVRRRLVERFGTPHPIGDYTVSSLNPARIAAATVEEIRTLQWTTRKAEYLIGLAAAIQSGALDGTALATLDAAGFIAALVRWRGVGVWTAEWLLARLLGRPTVVAGDLGVRKAIGRLYFNGRMLEEAEVRAATAHWGTAANAAQTLALHALQEGALGAPREVEG